MSMPIVYSMATRRRRSHIDLTQHISAVRAFHTGLIAEAQRRRHLLSTMAPHVDRLRHPHAGISAKLSAIEQYWRHLKELGRMELPWNATHQDLARSMRRLHHHLRGVARA
jgi:hypothetical protein